MDRIATVTETVTALTENRYIKTTQATASGITDHAAEIDLFFIFLILPAFNIYIINFVLCKPFYFCLWGTTKGKEMGKSLGMGKHFQKSTACVVLQISNFDYSLE